MTSADNPVNLSEPVPVTGTPDLFGGLQATMGRAAALELVATLARHGQARDLAPLLGARPALDVAATARQAVEARIQGAERELSAARVIQALLGSPARADGA